MRYEVLSELAEQTDDIKLRLQIHRKIEWLGDFDDKVLEGQLSNRLFYNAYVEFPFPFEIGDYVRYVDRYIEKRYSEALIGIVSTRREDFDSINIMVRDSLDFSDASVSTIFIFEDGSISHSHVCPIFLEKVEADEKADWYNYARIVSALL